LQLIVRKHCLKNDQLVLYQESSTLLAYSAYDVWLIVEGGIGEAVCSALALVRDIVVKHLAVKGVPRSGKPEELMSMFGIDAASIVTAVKEVLKL